MTFLFQVVNPFKEVVADTLSVRLSGPVVIVTQPESRIECEDHIVSFRVVLSGGTEPITFTWQRKLPEEPDFTDIPPGAPAVSYPSPGTIRVDNAGSYDNPGGSRYRVVISDSGGSVTSSDALLTVNEITDIVPSVAFPAKTNVILCEGAGFSLAVKTSGTPPVAFQWKKYASPGVWVNVTDNAIISGSRTAVLSFVGLTPAESGQYKVNITFHSSFTDCQIDSETRIRKLTVQGNLVPAEITNAETCCEGFPPPLLTAVPAGGGSGTFEYQWQASPDNLTWSDVMGANTLMYQPSSPVLPGWFRVNARDKGIVSCGQVTGLPAQLPVTDCYSLHYRTIKNGSWQDRTIWETSSDGLNWQGTAHTFPTALMRSIRIRNSHEITVSANVTVDEVTVEPGGAVTVAPGSTLENRGNAGDFTIQSSGNLFGSLIVRGNFSGQLQYVLSTDPSRWTIVSSPVKVASNFQINTPSIRYNNVSGDYDFAWYRESGNDGWQYAATIPGSVDPGRGYILRCADTNTPGKGMITFSGTLNATASDTLSPAVCNTGTRNGWNAIGNPFTSAIGVTAAAATAENFLTVNSGLLEDTYAALYVWNQTGGYDGTQQYYRAIGNSGYNFRDFGYYSGESPDYLQVGQGFLINVKSNGRAVFSGSMQKHETGVRLKSAGSDWHGLTLTASADKRIRNTVIAFHKNMTTGLDKTYDTGLLPADPFRLYTRLVSDDRDADLEVQCLPENAYADLDIPVGLELPEGGEVVFGTRGVRLPEGWLPFLEDRTKKKRFPLKNSADSCRIYVPAGSSGTGRFFLRFCRNIPAIDYSEVPEPHSWFTDRKLILSGRFTPGSVAVLYDVSGRQLKLFTLTDPIRNEYETGKMTPGIYLLKLPEASGYKVLKIKVIKK